MVKFSVDVMSLKNFLELPEFKPAFEYIGGRIIQKMSPLFPHSRLQGSLWRRLEDFARPRKLGEAFLELRCVFGGASQVPDIAFLAEDRIPKYRRGEEPSHFPFAPDLAVEILSPGQTVGELKLKLRHSLKHGSKLGWLILPRRELVHVLRPRHKATVLQIGDALDGGEVLPGFTLPLTELFSWLERA